MAEEFPRGKATSCYFLNGKAQFIVYLGCPLWQLTDLHYCQMGDISLFSFLYCDPFMREVSYYSRQNWMQLGLGSYL